MFPPLPDKKYGAILADPPWQFQTWGGDGVTPHRTKEDHYSTVAVRNLAQIPVADVADKDCALFMWVISSHIDQGIELGEAWGFKLKTNAFTWVKLTKDGRPKMGMGYYTRKQTEQCLLFTKGKPKRLDRGVPEVILARPREHSRKPDETYRRVERLFDGPYLEMFGRQQWPGWDVFGNQVDKFEVAA